MPERDDLDRLIDAELARYAEPRMGIEQRIMARVKAESSHRPSFFRGWQQWSITGTVTVAIMLAIVIPLSTRREPDVNKAVVTSSDHAQSNAPVTRSEVHIQAPHPNQTPKSVHVPTREPKSLEAAQLSPRPKLEIFPAPQPLSAEEQTFAELATRLPRAERERLLADQKSQDAPLEISAIKISPITMPALGKN